MQERHQRPSDQGDLLGRTVSDVVVGGWFCRDGRLAGFRCRFPRSAIARVTETAGPVLSRGVHGFGGRWLVNGSAKGLLTIDLVPRQRGRVMGFPVGLRRLIVSVEAPEILAAVLRANDSPGRDELDSRTRGDSVVTITRS